VAEKFVIETHNNSPKNVCIQNATLDEKPLDRPWFPARELLDGGQLVLEMGPRPNTTWGTGAGVAPPSMP